MGDLGTRFRLARESRNISLNQAEQDTRIRRKYLQALEDEDWASLPPAVYLKGFVRNYASYLGLDPTEALQLYHRLAGGAATPRPTSKSPEEPTPQRLAPPPTTAAVPAVKPPTRPMESRSWFSPNLLIGVGVLLAVILAAYFLLTSSAYQDLVRPTLPSASPIFPTRTTAPATVAATMTASVLPPTEASLPTAAVPVTAMVEVRVDVLLDSYGCWLEVYVDGQEDFRGQMRPGETRTWVGRERIAMHVGNAGGVEVTVNGALQGPLGAPGQVVDVEWTRPGAGPALRVTPGATPSAVRPATPARPPTVTPTPTAPVVTSTPTPTRPPTPTGTSLPTSSAVTPTP